MENYDSVTFSLSLLEKASGTSCPKNAETLLREFCSSVGDLNENNRLVLCYSPLLHLYMNQLISSFGVIPEFSGREFTSYDKSDFKGYHIVAHSLLKCAIACITLVESQQSRDESELIQPQAQHNSLVSSLPLPLAPSNSQELSVINTILSDENSSNIIANYRNCVLKMLPNILLLIGGNIRNPIWSSEDCQSLSFELLKCVKNLFGCKDSYDILVNLSFQCDDHEIPKSKHKSVLECLFHRFEQTLSRNRWEKNPFLCEVFNWLIPNVTIPSLCSNIDQIMATCLNFIHSHEIPSKLNGLLSLKHLIENVSAEELQWYNRADVIYDTLKIQIHSKEEIVLDSVLQCVFLILKVTERKPMENSEQHHEVMSILLRDTEMENLVIVRRVLISNLAKFILDCGILSIQHLSKILEVIETFLEIEDLPQETARIEALHALENVIVVAWPRMSSHSENILQFLLKLMTNIEGSGLENYVKEQVTTKTKTCVKLLLKVNPHLCSDLEEVKKSEKLFILKDFISDIS